MFCGLAVDLFRIGDVCCFPAPAHQPFSTNSLDLSAPEEAYSRNVCASGTLNFGYKGVFKILTTGSILLLVACSRGMRVSRCRHLIPDERSCHVLRIRG